MHTQNTQGSFKENLLSFAALIALLLFFSFGSYFLNVFAAPPAGNVAAPVNTGDTAQTKTGSLSVNSYIGASGQPVLYGRAPGTNETLLYFANGSKLRIKETAANGDVVTIGREVVGINNSNPNNEADLEVGSKGIRLGGLTRNEWPRWTSRQSGGYVPQGSGDSFECPNGTVMTGFRLRHGSGDKEYIGMAYCRQLEGIWQPDPEEDDAPERVCFTDEDGVEFCKN